MAASGDRRIGTGRRGMTVLGKIPSPAVPKPINLPSQKLENKGLETNVEIVPRGTFSWGSTSRNASSTNKSGPPIVTPSPPLGTGAWGGAAKLQAISVSVNESGNLAENTQPSSPSSAARPSSAPTSTRAWGTGAKSQSHGESSGSSLNPVESSPQEPQRTKDALPQKNIAEHSNRPMSADGTHVDKDRHLLLHPGASGYGRAGPGPGSVPGGFPLPGGAYSDHVIRQGMHPPISHDVPAGLGIYPRPPHHDVYYQFGVPHYNNMKDRDIAVVAMVNNAGYYGSYPPQVAHPEYIGQRPMYGNYGLRAPHPEHFIRPVHGNMGPRPHDLNMNMGYVREGEFLSHEGEGFYDPRKDARKHGDGYHGSKPIYGLEQNHRILNIPGRHMSGSREGRDAGNDFRDHKNPVSERAFPAVQPPEGKITLLTKTPRLEEENDGDMDHSMEKKGSEGIQNVEKPKSKVSYKYDEATDGKGEANDTINTDEPVEIQRKDGFLISKETKENNLPKKNELIAHMKDDHTVPKKIGHIVPKKDEHIVLEKDEHIVPKMIEQITLSSVSVGCKKDELQIGSIVTPVASLSSKKADSKNNIECVSSTQELHLFVREETKIDTEPRTLINNITLSESSINGLKTNKKSDKFSIPNSSTISTGEHHPTVSKESSKNTATAETSLKDEHKAKGRTYNQKAGKGWRPKSPVKDVIPSYSSHSLKVTDQASNTSGFPELHHAQSCERNDGSSNVRADKLAPLSLDERSNGAANAESGRHSGKKHHKEYSAISIGGPLLKDNHEEKSKHVSTDNFPLKEDPKAKPRQVNQKVDKEWRAKSPAVDAHVSVKVSGIQSGKQDMVDIESIDILAKKTAEQEASDAYDYEKQRAKLKEIAAQRAMQLRQEEEERAKEQRAKALAKLEELDRRTLALPTSVETSEHDTVIVNDDGANKKLKQKQTSAKHTAKDSPLNDSCVVDKDLTNKNISWAASTPSNRNIVKADEKRELSVNATIPLTARDSIDDTQRNMKAPQFVAGTHKDQRQHSRRVELDQVHDASSSKKLEVEKKKNEGTKSSRPQQERNHPQQERNHITEEHISIGVPIKDDKQLNCPMVTLGVEVHGKGGQSGRAASVQQRAKEGMHYKPKQMIAPDTNVPEEHTASISNVDKNSGMQSTSQQATPVSGLDSRHSSEKHGRLYGSWRQKHSSGDSSYGIGGNPKHTDNIAEGNFDNSVVKHRLRHMESVVEGKLDNSVVKPCVKHIDSASEGNIDNSVPKPRFKHAESVSGVNFDNAVVNPHVIKHMDSASEGYFDSSLGKSHEVRNGRKQPSKTASEIHKQGDIRSETTEISGMEKSSEGSVGLITSGPNLEEVKGGEAMKPGRSRNSWRQKNGHPLLKPSSMKEHSAEAKESHEEQLNFPQNELLASSELSHSNNMRNDSKFAVKVSSGPSIRLNNHRSPRVSSAPNQGKPPQQALDDAPNIGQQGRYSGSNKQSWDNKHMHETDNRFTTNQRKSGGSQWQAEEAAYVDGNTQGYKQPRKAKFDAYKPNRQYQPASQGFRQQPLDEHSESKSDGMYHGENRHGRGRDKSSRKAPLNSCSTSLELDRKETGAPVKSEISY